MGWDGGEASAGLTKDILALANCRDGGVIVVGKSEPQPGKFVLAGLSEPQAASFETTKVATQGQLPLTRYSRKDFHQKLVAPTAGAVSHCNAVLARMLLQ